MNSTFTNPRALSALAVAAALVAAPLAASAASTTSGPRADGGHRFHHKAGHHFNRHHRGFGHHDAARAFRALDLTQDQQDQLFKIRHDQAQAFYDGQKALRAAYASLGEVRRADSFDEAKAKQATDALGQAQAQMTLLRMQTGAQMQAVLTPEQRQKLADMRTHKGGDKTEKS